MTFAINYKLRVAVLVSKVAFQFLQDAQQSDYKVLEEVKDSGFQICGDELGSIVEGHDDDLTMKSLARDGEYSNHSSDLVLLIHINLFGLILIINMITIFYVYSNL
ncbi:putative calcium-transporting ATPase 11, plasma membrane-type [Cicer arietinum]|uniref:Uncharacterized protein LOC101507087 n=1 Tax=Cicer arietinum TaxID=3827 RepID=A0A1S3E718_CICAR|nr:uncharacterized protein LOC101507087 [Cicer arietinum]XP_027190208.1 uncharacterized protein LOC101507087 [Cicer arietinum]